MTDAADTDSCVVVGAGISGLAAAHRLSAAGWRVVVMDEGSEVGGRMATRRIGNGTFDYGAQFFTVRSERFEELVVGWLEAGVIEEWTRGFADAEGRHNDDGYPRYRGSEGMTSVPRYLARGLDVRTGERVVEANVRDGAWEVRAGSGGQETAATLLLAAPVPRSLTLIDSGDFELPDKVRGKLEGISYAPCLTLLALLDGPTGVPEPGGMQIKGEPLDWIGDNQRKGISEAPGITVHAGPEWSREHFKADEAEIAASLLPFTGEWLGTDLIPKVVKTSIARWRYSWVTQPYPEPYLVASEDPPLFFVGDAFAGQKVEGAALSGLAAADHLLDRSEG
ncbi:MAG TPA: FAD-dependent oxidoreductase [Rubrobacteraceae bacterium]|nr:FAD-dependent oxidoreductase [Rubrobacteraceae bacterium]